MIDLYYAGTPNGQKMLLFFEETGLPHRLHRIALSKGEQFKPEFLAISPNNKIPAMVDNEPSDGGPPLAMFESGAMLLYLAEKSGQLLPTDLRGRADVIQWLFWQVSGLGPMAGQNGHFSRHAPEKIPYAIDRYVNETSRLYRVLDHRLADREFIAGVYSIADIATYPWVVPHESHGQKIEQYPNLQRWFETIKARPAAQRAYAESKNVYARDAAKLSDEERRVLFGQSGNSTR